MIWVTSDAHLGHENIIKYCGRPFKSLAEMNEKIINNWNSRVNPDDLVYHLGDFSFRGKAGEYEKLLNGNIVHILGNHDVNSKVKTLITHALMEFGNKLVLATHTPPTMKLEIPEFCDFAIVGHVHQLWRYKWIGEGEHRIPMINVGIDVHNFMPISIIEVLNFYEAVIREKEKFKNGDVIQILNPETNRYFKIDRCGGIILETREDEGPFENIPVLGTGNQNK